jgi:hypothetical protein
MKVIWRRGQVTVRDVYEELLAQRKIAYTTVMTMMGILESKKYLRKSQGDRAYTSADGGDLGHGTRLCQPAVQWLGETAAGSPGRERAVHT